MNDIMPTSLDQPKKNNNKTAVIFVTVVIIILVITGFLVLQFQNKKTTKEKLKTTMTEPTTPPEPSPTPASQPTIDKKLIKIKVLNGTGTPGQASATVEILTKNGYNANTIQTGNADEYKTTTTTIKAKTGMSEVAKEMLSLFDDATVDSKSLDESDEYDIIITTGGKKFEVLPTPTSEKSKITPTPTPEITPIPTTTPSPTPTA